MMVFKSLAIFALVTKAVQASGIQKSAFLPSFLGVILVRNYLWIELFQRFFKKLGVAQ